MDYHSEIINRKKKSKKKNQSYALQPGATWTKTIPYIYSDKCLLPLNGYTELPSTYLLLCPGVTVLGHGGNLQVDAPSTSSASPLNEVESSASPLNEVDTM